MEQFAIHTGLHPTLHLHASGAVTFCPTGLDPDGWDDFGGFDGPHGGAGFAGFGSGFVLAVPA